LISQIRNTSKSSILSRQYEQINLSSSPKASSGYISASHTEQRGSLGSSYPGHAGGQNNIPHSEHIYAIFLLSADLLRLSFVFCFLLNAQKILNKIVDILFILFYNVLIDRQVFVFVGQLLHIL